MRGIRSYVILLLLMMTFSFAVDAQDCDVLISQRPVPDANSFIYATSPHTMVTSLGSVTFNAMTADGAIAVVFSFIDSRKLCVDERSNILIRFRDGEDIAMTNGGGANCIGRSAIYFSPGLGNMALLDMFRIKKIRFVKIWTSNGKWLRIDFADGMAYNLMQSMNCLADLLGAPVTASPAPRILEEADSTSVPTPRVVPRPQYNGGERALRVFFGRHMRKRSLVDRGVVVVSFLVDKEGNVRDPKVIRGVSEAVDNEARRLVSILPKWKPAMENGVPVSARIAVEIPF
jgi:TonB family protein